MPTFLFNKLVRDKLKQEYVRINQTAVYKPLSSNELTQELVNKIIEEAKEVPADGDKAAITAELADMKQAMDDLMQLHDISSEAVQEIQKAKLAKKGGFSKGYFVTTLTLRDDDEWVDYYRASPDVFKEIVEDDVAQDVPMIEPGIYEHYKGKRYEVVGVGLDSETLKPVVVYAPRYESDVPFYVRPYEMFLEFVDVDGTKVRRFERTHD